MPKNKPRRVRQKQKCEATDTDTSCPVKTTEHSHSKQSHLKGANGLFSAKAQAVPAMREDHRTLSEICYDAVILYSDRDRKTALHVKKWLEEHLLLQCGDSRHSPKIELMGNINSSYVTSLETATKRTETIIILCTEHFGNDALLKKAVHALWTWPAGEDLQIVPLLFGLESPPKCLSVSDAHIVHFETECEYFQEIMEKRLSRTLARRLQQDEKEGKNSHQQSHCVKRSTWPPKDTVDDECGPAGFQQMDTEEPEVTLTQRPDDCDSGVGSTATTFSGLTSGLRSLPSTDSPSSQLQCSLSGPYALSHDPCVHSRSITSPSPEVNVNGQTSENPSTSFSEASGSSLFDESTNIPVVQVGNGCEERYQNEAKQTETKSEAVKGQNACKAVPVPSTNATTEDAEDKRFRRNEVSHTQEGSALTTHTSRRLTTSSVSAENENSVNGNGLSSSTTPAPEDLQNVSTSVNEERIFLRAQNNPDLQQNPESNTSTQNQMTGPLLVPQLDVDQNCGKNPLLEQGKSELTDDTDVQTDGQMCDCAQNSVTASTDQSLVTFETSNSGSRSFSLTTNKVMKPSAEDPSQEQLYNEGYLTPVQCDKYGDHCKHCHEADKPEVQGGFSSGHQYMFLECEDEKLPDRESFESNNSALCVSLGATESRVEFQTKSMQKCEEITIERQKNLLTPAIEKPPNHSYVNTDRVDHPDHVSTRTQILSSMVHSHPSTMSVCNPVLESEVYETAVDTDRGNATTGSTATGAAGPQASTINVYHADSIIIHGTKCQIYNQDRMKPSVQIADEMCSEDTSTTYQTWPCKNHEDDHPSRALETLSTDDAGRGDPLGPQLPPRCGHGPGGYLYTAARGDDSPTTTKKWRVAILSRLRALICCAAAKAKTSEVQSQDLEVTGTLGDDEDLYERVGYVENPSYLTPAV